MIKITLHCIYLENFKKIFADTQINLDYIFMKYIRINYFKILPCTPFADVPISYFPRIESNFKIVSGDTPSLEVTIALPRAVEQEHPVEIWSPHGTMIAFQEKILDSDTGESNICILDLTTTRVIPQNFGLFSLIGLILAGFMLRRHD